jgi:hypothetical protein
MPNTICPHCQRELPVNHPANWCPFCGRDWLPDENPSSEIHKINWLVFFAVLFAPAMLSMLGMTINAGGLVFFSTFIGSGVAGIVCGSMIALRQARGMEANKLLVAVLSVLLGALSFFLCFLGCSLPIMFK